MPNRCVAAGCVGTCQVTVSHFSVFRKIHICAVFGPDKFNERGRIGSLLLRRFCAANISVSIASTTLQR